MSDIDYVHELAESHKALNEAGWENERLRAENEKLRAERDLWISRFEDFRKNAARLEEARSRPMRLVGSAAALKEDGDE